MTFLFGSIKPVRVDVIVQGAQPRSLASLFLEYTAMEILMKFIRALRELAGICLQLVYPLFVGILLGLVLVPLFMITWVAIKLLFLLVF